MPFSSFVSYPGGSPWCSTFLFVLKLPGYMSQRLETFLAVTTEGVVGGGLMASGGWRPGMLQNILQSWDSLQQQRIFRSPMTIIALRLRNSALNDQFTSCLTNPVHYASVTLASFQVTEQANSFPPRGFCNCSSHCRKHPAPRMAASLPSFWFNQNTPPPQAPNASPFH